MNDDVETFESTESGSSTFPQQCSALKKNGFVVMGGRPSKIMEMSTSKTGKHGGAKIRLVGIDIFNGKKYEEICPSTHNMDVPNVRRLEFQLIDITEDGFVSLLDNSGNTKDDLKLPEGELGESLRAAFDEGRDLTVAVVAALDEEHIMTFKDSVNK